jgi:mRNA interferase MazF
MYEQGDIVIVPFPFSDLSFVKQRPVLILSKTPYNQSSDDIITCGITSNLHNAPHSVSIDNKDLSHGKIPRPSTIKVDKLFTLSKSIIRKKVATIDAKTLAQVKKEFRDLL